MKVRIRMLLAVLMCAVFSMSGVLSAQQDQPQQPERRSEDATPPNQPQKATKEQTAAMNADLIVARAATKDHRYADAETLMLKDSVVMPNASLIWLELGFAQLGLKKYDDAGVAFQKALGIDPHTQAQVRREDFYSPADPEATHASRNLATHAEVTTPNLPPEVAGAAYSSLGEVYARTERVAEAQEAWDTAATIDPTHAALHLGNAAIIFNQMGISDAQVTAADKAIAVDPKRAILYYFKGQGLAAKATVDPSTQKMVLPPGCVDAYEKYLELDPDGKFAEESKEVLAAAGQKIPSSYTALKSRK
jgi:tetratricopeptide (TPR) repeat protein